MIKWLLIGFGTLTVLGGVATLWLPLPTGIPLLMIGLPVLLRYSPRARRWILSTSKNYPRLHQIILRMAKQSDQHKE